ERGRARPGRAAPRGLRLLPQAVPLRGGSAPVRPTGDDGVHGSRAEGSPRLDADAAPLAALRAESLRQVLRDVDVPRRTEVVARDEAYGQRACAADGDR